MKVAISFLCRYAAKKYTYTILMTPSHEILKII
jgi:hypothetical protein